MSQIVTRNCEECETEFETSIYRLNHGHGKYCSRSCARTGSARSRGLNVGADAIAHQETYAIAYREANRKKALNVRRKYLYGISTIEYYITLEHQFYLCAICGDWLDLKTSHRTCTDHDHKTGKFRGIVCHDCNRMLGGTRDNITTLQKAIEYLKR